MRMREAAEQVLFGRTLEEKLQLSPVDVDDSDPGKALATPDGPGRPEGLVATSDGVRADFPSENRLVHESTTQPYHIYLNLYHFTGSRGGTAR